MSVTTRNAQVSRPNRTLLHGSKVQQRPNRAEQQWSKSTPSDVVRHLTTVEDGGLHQFRGLAGAQVEDVDLDLVGRAPAGMAEPILHDMLRYAGVSAGGSWA